ncbi:hypothetical protein KPHVMX_100090 [Klebsiella pneumoniae]|nr:hypothetical protein KPHVMX_100090 [Klebsiella pneumoniae]
MMLLCRLRGKKKLQLVGEGIHISKLWS